MRDFWLYDFVSRARWLNYRGKIMLMAFTGTHIPLLAIIGYFTLTSGIDFWRALTIIGVALVATLAGTGITLFVLDQLLRPVIATARGLRRYRNDRTLPDLPTHYTDEAGTLMADAELTLLDLDAAMDELAFADSVTGLPNRERMLREISETLTTNRPFAVAVVRLDGYDRIVETFDKQTVDAVALHLADTLKTHTQAAGYLARIDDSTFAVILETENDVDSAAARFAAAVTDMSAPVAVGETTLNPELTVGMALSPQDGDTAVTLLDNAVSALSARNPEEDRRVHFFSPTARAAARRRFLTEQDLRRAIGGDEFRLHYQPVVDTGLGRIVGAEALIRWRHPEQGLLPPAAFIPIAEETGLIDPIGRWVINEACGQLRRWRENGRDDLRIAVNISARQFRDATLVPHIVGAMDRNGIGKGAIEIELTETAAMQDHDRAAGLFHALRESGIGIAIDDFGTGYSSMGQLLDLPFDLLKIDRRFVSGAAANTNARAICAALITLARGLKADVLAEGVETGEDVEALGVLGCRRFQGFYFGRPMPAVDFFAAASDLNLTATLMRGMPSADATDKDRRTA